jgi:hypothetical protein
MQALRFVLTLPDPATEQQLPDQLLAALSQAVPLPRLAGAAVKVTSPTPTYTHIYNTFVREHVRAGLS